MLCHTTIYYTILYYEEPYLWAPGPFLIKESGSHGIRAGPNEADRPPAESQARTVGDSSIEPASCQSWGHAFLPVGSRIQVLHDETSPRC